MRQIKFRAWDKDEKKMHQEVGVHGNAILVGDSLLLSASEYPLMQFTGLTDKNGKEIYEGDIIAFVGGNSIKTLGENSDIRVIEVLEDTKQLGWKGSGYTFCKGNCSKVVEVIGNVFENPELTHGGPEAPISE